MPARSTASAHSAMVVIWNRLPAPLFRGAGQASVQLHHPHGAVRHAGAAALPLAPGDHPAADAGGGVRVGDGLLYQPGAAGAGGGVPARDGRRSERPTGALRRSRWTVGSLPPPGASPQDVGISAWFKPGCHSVRRRSGTSRPEAGCRALRQRCCQTDCRFLPENGGVATERIIRNRLFRRSLLLVLWLPTQKTWQRSPAQTLGTL